MRNLKSSREKNKYKKIGILFCIVCIVAGICFLILNLNNYLDRLAEKMNGPDCSCKIKVLEKAENSNDEDTEASENSFFIYREKKESFQYDYHVMALDASGKGKKLFTLREDGMDLDRAPKLIHGKDKLYVLFEGIDNEDSIERVYSGKVGSDVQGLMPYLFIYQKNSGMVEEVKIPQSTEKMLIDVAEYDEDVALVCQRFKGVFFGLHLGWYMGVKTSTENLGKTSFYVDNYQNLFGDGGLKAEGVVDGESYYVLGQDGVYKMDLKSKTGSYIKKKDYGMVYRSDIKKVVVAGEDKFILVTGYFDTLNRFDEPESFYSEIEVYDSEWNLQTTLSIPVGISQLEWGEKSVMISGREFMRGPCDSYYIDLEKNSSTKLELKNPALFNTDSLDDEEVSSSQWVYQKDAKGYYYINMRNEGEKKTECFVKE